MQFELRRREFITLLGGAAAAWPVVATAQQPAKRLPTIGFLNPLSPESVPNLVRSFHQGLREAGYVEGENIAIEYRWAEGKFDRLPALAAELVRREVAVIVSTGGPPPALAAKAATATIPIVFSVGEDPVRLGLVASLSRPGGNLTGINFLTTELTAKRLGLLRELLPAAAHSTAVMVNPANAGQAKITLADVQTAARIMGLQIEVFNASTSREINTAFSDLVRERCVALFVGNDAFFYSRRVQLAIRAARHGVPAIFASREYAEAGGLMSYGTNFADTFSQVGIYAGRVLKGVRPSDLPVVQSSKFELVVNAETARTLGLEVPPTLLARADEVIE
jgi:putative ABC transport system substrate-binding protein